MSKPVGTLYAGGKEFFVLSRKPVSISIFGATFRCIAKDGEKYEEGEEPVLLVTSDCYVIVENELESREEESLEDLEKLNSLGDWMRDDELSLDFLSHEDLSFE